MKDKPETIEEMRIRHSEEMYILGKVHGIQLQQATDAKGERITEDT